MAVSEALLPAGTASLQFVPQLRLPMTVPVPVPVLVTVRVTVGGAPPSKNAQTLFP
jgi:hypothetical protein